MNDAAASRARLAARLSPHRRPTARRSAPMFRFFARYFARYLARHLEALRIARWGMPRPPPGSGPVIVYSNHPSWWDAAVYILAADRLFPRHAAYAPIDAAMLERYGFFARIGGYGVDLDSPRGAADFLAASADILSRPDSAIFVAAQGRFADVRVRPVGLRPGLSRLMEIAPEATVLPMAVEYAFWDQRGAEACIAFGEPRRAADLARLDRAERERVLEADLTAVMDRLAADVTSREPERFAVLVQGRTGIGGIYEAWKRIAAGLRGRNYDPAHGAAPETGRRRP